ncbi:alpha/beta hydrolase fold [Colletotrichum orchidophilum]|uniref:Alpha/beta hydrolase fold n=1 Tax=Colletotrichum orchidophilum TaxID=1209926 RepID=A0A1G4BAP0_9PEZI|nr:alpha/beta hydrolase fold [Colletotrichum orchidophilum]OHE98448.1 alpha/beta hydrolase fold [Colletotrichum orchidophilum]
MPYFARNPSFNLFYLDEGPASAPYTVLLITGLSCEMHDWSWQVPFLLSHNLRVISVDSRGQGKSSAPQPTPGIRAWPGVENSADPDVVEYYPQSTAEDMLALLTHLGVTQNLIVASHSLGDAAGYYIATARPDLVKASIGVDPIHAFSNAVRERDVHLFDAPGAQEAILPILIEHFSTYCYSPECPAWQKTWHLRRMAQFDKAVMYALCWGGWGDAEHSLGRQENAVKAFAGKLRCPRLTLGSDDWYVATDREHLPKGDEALDEVVLIEGKGHWFHQLESEEFNGHLERWFQKIGMLPLKVASASA